MDLKGKKKVGARGAKRRQSAKGHLPFAFETQEGCSFLEQLRCCGSVPERIALSKALD